MGIAYTLIGYLGREFFGIILSMPLGLLGILLGWGMFLMFGAPTDWHFWFWSVMGGAGVMAAVGASLAWLVGTTPRPAVASIALFVAIGAAGVIGAYAGYHWGQGVDTPCCARPDNSVFGYTASGAMAGALLAGTILGIISQRVWRLPRAPLALLISTRSRSSDDPLLPSTENTQRSHYSQDRAAPMAASVGAIAPTVTVE